MKNKFTGIEPGHLGSNKHEPGNDCGKGGIRSPMNLLAQ